MHQVLKLQEERAISAYLLKCGMDDQDPEEWDDVDSLAREGLNAEGLLPDEGEEDRDKEREDEMEEDASSEKDDGENEDQDNGDEPVRRSVCVSPVLPCSPARILIEILWGGATTRTRMWVGRLPEMT